MRIAILGSAFPFRGGLAAYNERLAQTFGEQGHEVEIYTFTVQYPKWLFPGKTQYRESLPPSGLRIIRSIHSLSPLSWWQTARKLVKGRFDLVVAKFWLPVMGLSLGSVLRLLRMQDSNAFRLTILDNVIPHEARIGDNLFTQYFIGSVDAAVAMSRPVAAEWSKLTSKPVRVLFHPLYDHYGEPVSREEACRILGLDPRFRYILFFGLIRPYKGLDLLLEAWASDRLRAHTEARLLIAGELYEAPEKYQSWFRRSELQGRYVFHEGFIPEEQVKYYFSAADAVVQPYRSATQSGITQIAYHFEKPMIVTQVGALPEMVPDGKVGFVCEPTSAALSVAIDRILQLPSGYFLEALRNEKRRYSWDAFATELLSFVRSLHHEEENF
ncbi:MAG: glycosyltransferase [Bacteroidia bacterium]|nr:glycosyltransferase [Bacteroidia bacterium]